MAEPVLLKSELPGLKHVVSARSATCSIWAIPCSSSRGPTHAFDVIMANGIPYKGKVLNRISEFWFDFLCVPNHMITCDGRRDARRGEKTREGPPRPRHAREKGGFRSRWNASRAATLTAAAGRTTRKAGMVCGIKLRPD